MSRISVCFSASVCLFYFHLSVYNYKKVSNFKKGKKTLNQANVAEIETSEIFGNYFEWHF